MAALASGFRRRRDRRGNNRRRWPRGSGRRRVNGLAEIGDRAKHFATITENDAQLLQVLISQIGKDFKIDAVLRKALRVLGHAEIFEPVRNFLHRGAPVRRTLRYSA